MKFLENKKILIIITGGIAAYKTLDLIRKLSKLNCEIKTILTKSGKEFVTPLSITSLSKNKVYTDLFSVENESEINIFFDNKTFNLVGWQTKDIYQNINVTYLSLIKINQKVDKNLFKLPLQN